MKGLLLATIYLLFFFYARAQPFKEETLYQTKSKTHLYYVALTDTLATVFEMGTYLDKAGTGYSIRKRDTLLLQQGSRDTTYNSSNKKILTDNGSYYLQIQNKKSTKYPLNLVTNKSVAFTHLNNAYYLHHFFAMSDTLNKRYPLQHYSFRNGFYSWKELLNQDTNYVAFIAFADNRLRELKDSISKVHDTYTAITNSLIQNSRTIPYTTLKEDLSAVWSDSNNTYKYIAAVATAIAKSQPAFFFKLAADFPNKKSLLFDAIEDKQAIENLQSVVQYTAIKKEFFKNKRSDKRMPYRIIAPYAILAGLITFFIIR